MHKKYTLDEVEAILQKYYKTHDMVKDFVSDEKILQIEMGDEKGANVFAWTQRISKKSRQEKIKKQVTKDMESFTKKFN